MAQPEVAIDRIEQLPAEVVSWLGYMAVNPDAYEHETRRKLYDRLPKNMTEEEVANLGLLVGSHAELTVPSRSGYANAYKTEAGALFFIGNFAYVHGDDTTLGNIIKHLKSHAGLSGKIGALTLSRQRGTLLSDFVPGQFSRHSKTAPQHISEES